MGDNEDAEAAEAAFNPMEQEYNSIANAGFTRGYELSALAIGGIQAEGDYRSIRDVPCLYNDGTGKCFKGKYCVRAHPLKREKVDRPLLALQHMKIFTVSDLPPIPLIKVRAGNVTTVRATVCSIISPIDFYIMPHESVCICGCQTNSLDYVDATAPLTGLKGLEYLLQNLDNYLSAKKREFIFPYYKVGQLVVCEVKLDVYQPSTSLAKFHWFRGIIEGDVVYSDKEDVDVWLVDVGKHVSVQFHKVVSLPQKFLHIAPLAIRAHLVNISSVGYHFSGEACQSFKSTYELKVVMCKIYEGPMMPMDGDISYLYGPTMRRYSPRPQDKSYAVDLMFSDESSSLNQMSETSSAIQFLSRQGYAIVLNPFPMRPSVMEKHKMSLGAAMLWCPLVKRFSFEDMEGEGKTIEEKILASEIARVEDQIERNDGYIPAELNSTLYLSFPKAYAKPAICLSPEKIQADLPKRVMEIEKIKKTEIEESDVEDEEYSSLTISS